MVQVRKKGNKKTLYECLFGRIEWDSPISERASELAKSEACRPKGGSHGKAVIVCAKGKHNQVHKRVTKKHSTSDCLKIEWDSPISERASELAKSEACRPKGGSHGKAVIVCAKGEHNQVHKKGNKKNTLRVFVW